MASHSIHPKNIGSKFICFILMQWDTFITRVLQGPGVALSLSTSCMWNLSPASQKKPQFGLTRVISEAITVLYGSTHRRCLFYFPSLEFLLCHFPSVEMKGQIAIWNPYIKVRNYSLFFFFFYCRCHFGENILIDQNESPRGSVVFPYLNVKERQTTIFLVWLKSSISWRPMVPPSSSWSSDFSQACEQKNQELCPSGLWCRLPCPWLSRKDGIS